MFYNTISDTLQPIEKYFLDLTNPPNKNFMNRVIKAKFGHGSSAMICFIGKAADCGIAILSGSVSFLILNSNKSLTEFTMRHSKSSEEMLSVPYKRLMKIVNAGLDLDKQISNAKDKGRLFSGTSITSKLTFFFSEKLENKEFRISSNWIVRNVVYRITLAALIVFNNVMTCIDLAVGVTVATLSLFTFGRFKLLNNIASSGLEAMSNFGLNDVLIKNFTGNFPAPTK